MFGKARISKFLLCAFSAGFGANLVGHATLGVENVNQLENLQKAEEDAQKDGLLYVEKDDDNANKGFVYLDIDDDNNDVTNNGVSSEENIKKFVRKACGRKSSTVRKVVFVTSLGIGGIYSVIYGFINSPDADSKDPLKALEEKGISVKFLDENGNEVPTEGNNETVTGKRVDIVNSGDGKGDGAAESSGINPNDVKDTTKDVTTTEEQNFNSADNQTNSVQSGTPNQDVKTSEENQRLNMGLKEWLLVGGVGLFVFFVVVFVIYYNYRKAKSSSLSSTVDNPIFLYYHAGESEPPPAEKNEDQQGYSILGLFSIADKSCINRKIIGENEVPSLKDKYFKMRKKDFFDYYKNFVDGGVLADQDVILQDTYVFLHVLDMSGSNLKIEVLREKKQERVDEEKLGGYDFYASLSAFSQEYGRLMSVLTKPDYGQGQHSYGSGTEINNNNIFSSSSKI